MRACEGCRRRKIKCDAATTNAWPCAACIRLKLNCVPPTVSYDKDYNPGSQTFELETKPLEYAAPTNPPPQDYQRQAMMPHGMGQMPPAMPTPVSGTYADGMRMYQTAPYDHQQQDHLQYSGMPQPQVIQQNVAYTPQQMYSEPPSQAPALTMSPPETDGSWRSDPSSTLAEALGELKIDHTAVGECASFRKHPPSPFVCANPS